ncbi:MAG TPA: hypothetical protein VHJ20_07650 [Polyangia bacterium]|nr:hypothetical protein [Polyangia bacterium]
MSEGCTSCGRKGGCDARKHVMFAAVDEALARLYPTRRWAERDEAAGFGAGVTAAEGEALSRALASRLQTLALHRPGTAEETCDYIYVLCVGRTPSIVERVHGVVASIDDAPGDGAIDELYLRVALSTVARFAGVQQVALRARRGDDGALVVDEEVRAGVFDPILLPRFQKLVAVLAEHDVRHLDFGEIVEPPADFDPGDYADRYGGAPAIANYLFFPQPATLVTTTIVA